MSNHPPIANKLVMVDFDGTIIPWGPLMQPRAPFDGVAEALQMLSRKGFRIGIFTSRLSPTWMKYAGTTAYEQQTYIATILAQHDIPYDLITAEKLPAEAYFDDKAWHVEGNTLAEVIHTWSIQNAA